VPRWRSFGLFSPDENRLSKKTATPQPTPLQPALDAASARNGTARTARLELINLSEHRPLTAEEQAEFEELQDKVIAYYDSKFPRRLPDEEC